MTLTQTQPVRPWCGRPVWAVFRLAATFLTTPLASAVGQNVAEVQVTPETMTLAVNQRQALFAAAYDRQGNLIASAKFTFWSSDTLIVRVMRDGTVVGVGPGLAKVEARVQRRRASMAVLVTGGRTDSVAVPAGSVLTLDPSAAALLPGESVQLRAEAIVQDGSPVAPGRVSWKTLAAGVATVDSTGVVVGVGPGRTIIQAAASGLMATAPVTVEPTAFALTPTQVSLSPNQVDTLHAVVPSQGNREIRGGVQWSSSDTAVVQVGPSGIVTARGPGQASVLAAGFSQSHRTEVKVHRLPQALVVAPPAGAVHLAVNGTRQVSAVAEAADSTPIPEARLDWAVGDTAIIGYDLAARTLTGKAAGTTTLTARLAGFDPVVWNVEVTPGLVSLDRRRLALKVGERGTLKARVTDEAGTETGPANGFQWSSDHPEAVRVSGEGIVDGLALGHAVVTTTSPWGRSDSADVFVTSDAVVASNRSGAYGIYQFRAALGDTLVPLLVDGATNVQAVYAPDRTRLVFSSNRTGTYDLFVMDADGRNLSRITTDPGNESEPRWTPDGARVVYTLMPAGGLPQIRSVGLAGQDDRPITTAPGGNQSPAISRDGRKIAFVSNRDGNQEIYLSDLAGGAPRRLTQTKERESSPRFLPDGTLVYVTKAGGRGKGSKVMRLEPGAPGPTVLVTTERPILSLDVSLDGTRLIYVMGQPSEDAKGRGEFRMFMQPLAGGSAEEITLRAAEQVVSPAF